MTSQWSLFFSRSFNNSFVIEAPNTVQRSASEISDSSDGRKRSALMTGLSTLKRIVSHENLLSAPFIVARKNSISSSQSLDYRRATLVTMGPKSPYLSDTFCILKISLDDNYGTSVFYGGVNLYKSILVNDCEKTPAVIRNALGKHGKEEDIPENYDLVQVLSAGGGRCFGAYRKSLLRSSYAHVADGRNRKGFAFFLKVTDTAQNAFDLPIWIPQTFTCSDTSGTLHLCRDIPNIQLKANFVPRRFSGSSSPHPPILNFLKSKKKPVSQFLRDQIPFLVTFSPILWSAICQCLIVCSPQTPTNCCVFVWNCWDMPPRSPLRCLNCKFATLNCAYIVVIWNLCEFTSSRSIFELFRILRARKICRGRPETTDPLERVALKGLSSWALWWHYSSSIKLIAKR